MASTTTDDGFHEIQLNGKQLIFLFMAVTVVSVVIFLFGVLVGRGVREGAEPADNAALQVAPDSPPPQAAADSAAPTPAGTSEAQVPAAPPAEELSYAERLLRDTPADENLKTSAASAPVIQEPLAEKTPAPPPAASTAKGTAPAPVEPAPRTTQPPTSAPVTS